MEAFAIVTPRRLVVALVLMLGIRLALPYASYPVNLYKKWLYPPQGGPTADGDAILADNEKREAGKIEARYRKVLAELQQARAQGFDTAGLEAKANAALTLNNAQYRRSAIRILSEVEMGVPKPRVNYIPMGPTEAPGEEIEPDAKPVVEQETPAPAATAKVSKKKKKRARRRQE